jgi:hypothetical protein
MLRVDYPGMCGALGVEDVGVTHLQAGCVGIRRLASLFGWAWMWAVRVRACRVLEE